MNNVTTDPCKDSCLTGINFLVKSGANSNEEDFIGAIEALDNEVRSSESPALVMLEVDNLDTESDELDFESKVSLRRSEHGDAAFCGGNLDFSEYV